MEQLVPLPPITKLSPLTTRILGQNPGKFTLQGTNTYLLGTRPPYILLDTGEGKDAYISLLEEVLMSSSNSGAQLVSDVVLSHKHADHHAGLPSVLSLLAEHHSPAPVIHKFPLSSPDPVVESTRLQLPAQERTWADLSDGQVLRGEGVTLRILYTPGHTEDSICLYLEEEEALFTADAVLGQGTTVFEDLGAYMSSLRLLLERFPRAEHVYPGHGPVVERGRGHIGQYIAHREEREEEILAVLRQRGGTVREIVRVVYARYEESLWGAAERGVRLHLLKLEGEGRVRRVGERWEVV
ncbi:Metallo-hydrolase/oxidoreductase [Dacryopinax primogenitus]|uniref:Metallo-hydrolase/oxidoreductase n=1 Tax=Dacryopinax primogenitus (strain DJM 731) TaxID=1858805 RepID=M5GAE2_DACPD|nr:Metallo-hydrolase/oxidoreductase [Dacryopinax primogenitus]EJU05799.1 Metallo-hydrolase/oxidoreductase [Dacryopinax primogenitus]